MNNNAKRRIWLTEAQQLEAIARYQAGESPRFIGKLLGVCANNVNNTLRRYSIVMRNRSEARIQYAHWQDAFDVITPESAYWIGFLFADGWIYRKRGGAPVLGVGIAKRDCTHLEKLRAFLRAEHPIYPTWSKIRGKRHAGVRLQIASYKLTTALSVHGMRVAKSLLRIPSPVLADSRDFWRGFIDGDGYVGVPTKKVNKVRIGICGGRAILNVFLTFLRKYGIGLNTKTRRQKKIFRFDLNCGPATAAVKLLYSDATVVLDRKATRATIIMAGS